MRVFASWLALASCVAACSPAQVPAPSEATSPPATHTGVDPTRVERVRSNLPTGYEFTPLPARAAPIELWGFGPQWTADPASCAGLGDPAGEGAVNGWSASGPGNIVYAVVAATRTSLDQAALDACGSWSVSAGHTTGVVTVVDPPLVEGARTLGLSAEVTTTVEGGTETHSHAETFAAYLGDHVAHVTVVTDPGSPAPSLGPGFASDLLVTTVAALRG
jgi:uncharacterized protein DUF5642